MDNTTSSVTAEATTSTENNNTGTDSGATSGATNPPPTVQGNKFVFELGAKVQIKVSEERGEVTGRAEYTAAENAYHVRYLAGDGRATQQWWPQSALVGRG